MTLSRSFTGFLLAGWLLLAGAWANAQTYRSSWDQVKWQLKPGAFACSLSQTIAGFGELRLIKKAGMEEQLQLLPSARLLFAPGWARVDAEPLAWQPDTAQAALARIRVPASGGLSFGPGELAPLLSQLQQGRQLVFSGQRRAGGDSLVPLRAVVQPRFFADNYDSYQSCRAQIIPYTFAQIARMTIYYAEEAQDLNAAARATLDKVARYAKADSSVLGVIVDAHSDARADEQASDDMSKRQAELVTQYLLGKGLPEEAIRTRWHGDKYPVASNATERGKAQNRRITLRLENAGTRQKIEDKIAARKRAQEAKAKAEAEAAAKRAAAESADEGSGAAKAMTLKDLERMVENQDLRNGKQPTLKSTPKN